MIRFFKNGSMCRSVKQPSVGQHRHDDDAQSCEMFVSSITLGPCLFFCRIMNALGRVTQIHACVLTLWVFSQIYFTDEPKFVSRTNIQIHGPSEFSRRDKI